MDGKRLRLGAAGCGAAFERFHYPALALSADWDLVATCDPSPQRRAWARRALGDVPVFESFAELLGGPRLDALLVATPPETHAELVLDALRSGLPVLVEKPLATRLSDARGLLDAASASGTTLRVGFNRRFRSGYAEVRNHLAAGAGIRGIRHVFAAEERWRYGEPSGDSFEVLLHDVACHQVDLVAWITGTMVREARALPFDDGGKGVHLFLRLAGGLVAQCAASYSPRYVERMELDLPVRKLIVRPGGVTRGRWSGRWGERSDRLRQAVDLAAGRCLGRPTRTLRSFQRQLTAFAEAIRGAPSTGADVQDGFRAVAVIAACLQSLSDGGAWKPVAAEAAVIAR